MTAMLSPAQILKSKSPAEIQKFMASLTEQEAEQLLFNWRGFHARPDQLEPKGDWDIWIALAGRGWGKTRTGSGWIEEQVYGKGCKRIALIAETQKDLEDVMINGDSGIMNTMPHNRRPLVKYKPVKLIFPNGALALGYNGTQPDQLRGPQFDAAWIDELAKYRYAQELMDQLAFGLRLGEHPRLFISTTPRPTQIIKNIVAGKEGKVVVTYGRTMDNADNLAGTFLEKVTKRYKGTRLGQQELDGKILGDLPGALWTMDNLSAYRINDQVPEDVAEELGRIVIGVDPAVTQTDESNEHGIVAVGLSPENDIAVVLEDASVHGSPNDWANKAIGLYHKYEADAIVAEVNQGGDMVENTIRSIDANVKVIQVRATRGKHIRAEPIAALYNQGRIRHVGYFDKMEEQMTQFTSAGYEGEDSPDRVDAAVWALTNLFKPMTRHNKKRKTAVHTPPVVKHWKGTN